MRELLNLTLQSTILYGDAQEMERILQHARTNTMLLQMSHTWIEVALRVS